MNNAKLLERTVKKKVGYLMLEDVGVNDKMCRIYGLTKEQALKVSIEDVSNSRMSMKVLLDRWKKALNGEKLLFEWEARRPKDESIFQA